MASRGRDESGEHKTANKRRRGEPVPPNQHIRFGGDASEDAVPPNDAASTAFASDGPITLGKSRRKNKQKRKRQSSTPTAQKEDLAFSCGKIFNGLIVAISTLESKNRQDGDDRYQNYKMLKETLQTLGATIAPQVHKRVHYLVSTESAVRNLTQRVRQAIKRNVDIVDAAWVKECEERNARVDAGGHSRNELARRLVVEREEEKRAEGGKGEALDAPDGELPGEGDAGWTTPVQLDCCCVCHENGDDNCPWCVDCNLTLAKKRRDRKPPP